MSSGCFSWWRWGAKKQIAETKPQAPEKQPEILPVTKSDEQVVPTHTAYAMATVKKFLTLSQSAAGIAPVPFLQEAIDVALKIMEVCEEASAVEEKVKELQVRIGDLMMIIVGHVTPKNEEGSKKSAVEGIEENIVELLSTLKTINGDLTKISAQNRWVIAIYKELNMSTVDDCMNRLSTAMQKFTFANDLRDSARIDEVHVLLRNMANQFDNMCHDLPKYLAMSNQSATLHPSDAVPRQEIPLKPEVFYGRDDFVEHIARLLLQEETSRVCILGPGGMGKTSVSLAVVELSAIKERFLGRNIIWVPCIEATSATLLLELLYMQLQVPGDKQVTLENIISHLDASKQPRLILLDNFETPWNAPADGTQKQVSDILRKLTMLRHVAILVTMRGTYPPCDAIEWQSQAIPPTDEAACRRIFHDINPSSKGDPDVDRLLSTLGHMPFAVTLMANLGKRGRSTAKELLETWYESGTDMLSVTNSPEKSMNRSISLSVDSEFVKQDPNALLLLAILSLLPAGTTKENLRWWATAVKMIPSAIATLSDAGLLVENKRENSASPVLFVVPVVQSFMQQHDRIAVEIWEQVLSSCCEYVLAHASRFDDPTFPKKSQALAAEDTNIQFIFLGPFPLQLTPPDDRTMEALIAFGWHRCDTMPNPRIADRIVAVARLGGVVRYYASANWCEGQSYAQLGDYYSAYDYLREAYQLFSALPLGEIVSQRLGGQCGIDLVDAMRVIPFPEHEKLALARDVETKCAALSDDVIHGRSLVLLGAAYSRAQQPQEALRCLEQALTVLKAAENTFNLSEAYHTISCVHYDEGRLPAALDAAEEAWKLALSIDNPIHQAWISLNLAKILFSANEDMDAWNYIEITLMKGSYENRLTIARALEYLGYGYLRRGQYQNAYGAYEAAAEGYLVALPFDNHVAERCKENMARIKQKEENSETIVGFYRPDIDIDKTLFYPPVRASANDMPISGS